MLWLILLKFLCRLTLGLAAAMWVTPPTLVTSGYYRVHLWVLMGINTFAALIAWSIWDERPHSQWVLGAVLFAAVASYLGSVLWLYERPVPGRWFLGLVATAGLVGAHALAGRSINPRHWLDPWAVADNLSASWLIGATLAAMFLGHWYLNTPSMQLAPLQRLVMLIVVGVVLRAMVSGSGLYAELAHQDVLARSFWPITALRWLSGIFGTAVLAVMTWQTLKIPNTQSATGILYVAVIFVFLGELTSQLMTLDAMFPL